MISQDQSNMSAISQNSLFSESLNSGAYKTISLPTEISTSDPTTTPFKLLFTPTDLTNREILKEYDSQFGENKYKREKAKKLYKKVCLEYNKLLNKKDEMIENGTNHEWISCKILRKECEILKFEKFFQIEECYIGLISLLKDYEYCYRTENEKAIILPVLKMKLEQFNDLIKQLKYLDLERHKLIKLQDTKIQWFKIKNFINIIVQKF